MSITVESGKDETESFTSAIEYEKDLRYGVSLATESGTEAAGRLPIEIE